MTHQSGPAGTLGTGRVGSDGTLFSATNWTCGHPELGVYVVTHNLHLEDPNSYVVLGTPCVDPPSVNQSEVLPPPQTSLIVVVGTQTSDSFTIYLIEGSTLSYIDKAFNFAVFR